MIPDLSPLAEHAALLDGHRPERLGEVHERIGAARRRRRRSTVGAAAAAVAAILAAVAVTAGLGDQRRSEPVEQPGSAPARPLTYAVGETIHYGDRTLDVGEDVQFLAVTDEGVAFVREPLPSRPSSDKPLWFTDGRTVERIGTTSGSPARGYAVVSGETGPYLVLQGTGEEVGNHLVIDTRTGYLTHRERSAYGDRNVIVLGVHGDTVDFVHLADNPCQRADERGCLRYKGVARYHVVEDRTTWLPWAEYDADLRSRARTVMGPDPGVPAAPGSFWRGRGLVLERRGADLVLPDEYGSQEGGLTVARTGEPLRLSVPPGAGQATRFELSQWLDDDRLVLFGYTDPGLPEGTELADEGDVFVCSLSTGSCRLELRGEPGTTYQLPGLD